MRQASGRNDLRAPRCAAMRAGSGRRNQESFENFAAGHQSSGRIDTFIVIWIRYTTRV